MLQQTQVDRVVPFYERFVGRFPSFKDLARASARDVLAAWQGLGYNRRALNLQRCAAIVVCEYDGVLPDDPDRLVRLPGIGAATAASIAAFAFDKPTVFIETNIRAVYIHHFFDGRAGVTDAQLLPLVGRTLDRRGPCLWYSALMDYGVHLKKLHGNPARRSAHHTRQSRFEGSDRQVRGLVLKALLAVGAVDPSRLSRAISVPVVRVGRALDQLSAEGFAAKCGRTYRIL